MSSIIRRHKDETVSLRNAKATLSHLTKRANQGARVVITNHGTPIADLVQHGTEAKPIGYLKPPGALPKAIRLRGAGPTASALVLTDREG
jgi:prevent-host-death family protein